MAINSGVMTGLLFARQHPYMRVILIFYRNFLWPAIGISLFACWLIWMSGSWHFIAASFWMKVVTNLFLGLSIHIFSPNQLPFFNNLGYNTIILYTYTFLFDMMLWLLLSWVTIEILL
ncbi:MAG TPA: hypothetical protein VFZ52_22970 [Chryseolinea sp.]